jgi:hypothetical protein
MVADLENFIDVLLFHIQEDKCSHSVIDLIKELLYTKNGRGTTPRPRFNEQIQPSTETRGGLLLNEFPD